MYIHEFYYHNRRLYVEFSLKEEKDKFYRIVDISYNDIIYYYPSIIIEEDLVDIDISFVVELLNEYYKENDLPDQLTL